MLQQYPPRRYIMQYNSVIPLESAAMLITKIKNRHQEITTYYNAIGKFGQEFKKVMKEFYIVLAPRLTIRFHKHGQSS